MQANNSGGTKCTCIVSTNLRIPTYRARVKRTRVAAVKQNWDFLLDKKSSHQTPIVDYLLETSPYAKGLAEKDIEDIRNKERNQDSEEDLNNRVRKLKISFANKNKRPWNLGKKHRPGGPLTIAWNRTCCV
jgi:hypothetical protein